MNSIGRGRMTAAASGRGGQLDGDVLVLDEQSVGDEPVVEAG